MNIRDTRRDHAIEKIHEAVEEAIRADMNVQDFVSEARESWRIVLEDHIESASRQFDQLKKL